MKCICGYEHKSGVDSAGKWQDNLVGDKPFRQVIGCIFRIKAEDRYDNDRDVNLFSCPKCNTVQVET